jgi:hypothetical protein
MGYGFADHWLTPERERATLQTSDDFNRCEASGLAECSSNENAPQRNALQGIEL